MSHVDLRCPFWPRTKFAEVSGETSTTTATGLLHVTCRPCRRATDASQALPVDVVHTFNLRSGKCVKTQEKPRRAR